MRGVLLFCVLGFALSVTGCGEGGEEPGQVPERSGGFQTATPSGTGGSGGDTTNPTSPDAREQGGEGSGSDGQSSASGCQSDEDCADMLIGQVCREASCDLNSGICSVGVVPDGTPCGEDDMCKSAGACGQGFCIGQPVKCDDGNPCTDGSCKEGVGCVYYDNTAVCDDQDPCTSGDMCAAGKCTGTPVASCGEGCGDGLCADDEDCQNCAVDCSPCSGALCEVDEVENCDGGCSLASQVGDGGCQSELDCAETAYDGGDCAQAPGSCSASEVEACGGICVSALAFAQLLSNDQCDEELNCATFDYDTGACIGGPECGASDFICADGACISSTLLCDGADDCDDGSDEANCAEPGTCEEGKALGCTGTCYTAAWFGDGTCDSFLDCAETGWDAGDCTETPTGDDDPGVTCDPGKTLVCAGTYCLDESWLGDGMCDQPMDCAATGYDGGDCEEDTGSGPDSELECPEDKEPNCSGSYCYNSVWIGDGTCDSFFDCASTGYDGGDCL